MGICIDKKDLDIGLMTHNSNLSVGDPGVLAARKISISPGINGVNIYKMKKKARMEYENASSIQPAARSFFPEAVYQPY